MRVVVATFGSRGDVQPYLALALGLRAAGFDVTLAANHDAGAFVQARGIPFAPLGDDIRLVMEGALAKAWLESGRNAARFLRDFVRLGRAATESFLTALWEACRDADAIVFSSLSAAAYNVAERSRVPAAAGYLVPSSRTRYAPTWLVPGQPDLGAPLNYLSHLAVEQAFWHPFRAATNRWRRTTLGLPPLPFIGPAGRALGRRLPVLYGYSPAVLPPPPDWPPWHHVTGYWFLDRPPDWRPSPELVAFLEAGTPPVYAGFGSMTARDPERLTRLVLDAFHLSGRRGILLGGWAGLGKSDLPADVLLVQDVPHDWLFPRVAAVIHHGGAGTTAAGLRAGVPSLLVPFFADQPFWGDQVARLGVGPRPIPYRKLTAERLAAAIAATDDRAMRERASTLGATIRGEDGVGKAVAILERAFRR